MQILNGRFAITETIGLGSFAMAGEPAVVEYIGGTAPFAMKTTLKMYEVTAGGHQTYKLLPLTSRALSCGWISARLSKPE